MVFDDQDRNTKKGWKGGKVKNAGGAENWRNNRGKTRSVVGRGWGDGRRGFLAKQGGVKLCDKKNWDWGIKNKKTKTKNIRKE